MGVEDWKDGNDFTHKFMHFRQDIAELPRAVKEIEAEAVAYLVGSHFGLTGIASPDSMALWEADEQKILARMERIRVTSTEIIKAIEPHPEIEE